MNIEIINGKEFHEVTLRGRTKLIARDGEAINPYRRKQKATMFINQDGYPCYGGGIPVHMYVAYGWVDGWFKGAEINHKDFNRMNYNADNLEWVTHQENIKYSSENNPLFAKSKQGINNGRATFTEEKIREIRKLYDEGYSIVEILKIVHPELTHTKDYKNLHSTYLNICKRKTWKNLQ